ncbi:MAG: hypothetical protein ABH823_03505, partial [bacterium]
TNGSKIAIKKIKAGIEQLGGDLKTLFKKDMESHGGSIYIEKLFGPEKKQAPAKSRTSTPASPPVSRKIIRKSVNRTSVEALFEHFKRPEVRHVAFGDIHISEATIKFLTEHVDQLKDAGFTHAFIEGLLTGFDDSSGERMYVKRDLDAAHEEVVKKLFSLFGALHNDKEGKTESPYLKTSFVPFCRNQVYRVDFFDLGSERELILFFPGNIHLQEPTFLSQTQIAKALGLDKLRGKEIPTVVTIHEEGPPELTEHADAVIYVR